jgi:EthD domain
MIRLVHLLRRKAGTTLAEFSDYWRAEHGPLVASYQSRLGILRYTQTHRDPTTEEADAKASAARGGMEPSYDGVADFWWDSEATLVTSRATKAGNLADEALMVDEGRFVDQAESPFWFAHEYPQVSALHERAVARPKTGVVKQHFSVRPVAGLSVPEAQLHWRTIHGPLVRSYAVARGLICYQQVHRYESALLAEMRAARGTTVDVYMGHAEAWFDRLIPRGGPELAEAMSAAVAEERKFIDWQRSTRLTGKELIFVERNWL